jgi:hypothetical protein
MAVFVSALLAGLVSPTHAALITFSDLSTFLATTGASAAAPIPNSGSVPNGTSVGDLTYSAGPRPGEGLFFGTGGPEQWSTLLGGNEIALNEFEDLNVDVATPVRAFGFEFHEPNDPADGFTDVCNAPCFDSTFEVTLLNGGSAIGSFQFNAPDATAAFVGVSSDIAFNRVEIREIQGGIDNEFYGQFYTASVPEPGTLLLVGIGLAGLGGTRRLLWRSRASPTLPSS